ncbi:MAG: hypothetical protein HN576_09350 [Bacteriovoracaceae bacterium]|nr:hypothetical protein [Bacteriovoracaceae bacterium]
MFEDLHQRMNTINLNTDGKFGETYKSYEQLVSIIDDFTKFNNDFTNKVLIGLRQDEVLRGLQLTLLHKSVKYYLMMSSKMITLAEQIEPEDLREIDDTFYVGSEEKKRKTLLWYAIHMKNLDHFLKTYSTYLHNKKLRLLLNDADSAFELKSDELKNYIATMISKKSVKIYQRATRGFNLVNDYGEHNQLKESIYTMYSTSLISETGKKGLYKIRKDLKKGYRKDKWSKVGRFLLHHASGFFGNRMGAIKFRKGFLLNNSKLNTQITKILRPLDIITEKTPFILTDKFIPGHFGHNAVWLGTKDQLIKTGMWDHPRIIPLRGMIEKGYSIIETDRSGTHLKNIDKFMNVDWFAIMRLQKTFVDENYLKNTYEAALSQLGKLYDFNFDVETTHKLVCSELLYQSFGEVVWPTERYLGRTTISPDNIASLALYENTPMSLVYYVRGDENKNVIDLTEDRWAIDLGFRKNIDLSTDALSYYERPYKKCVNIIKSNNKRKVCTTTYKHYVYKPLSNY